MKVAAKELIEKKEYPAISIVLPTHPKYPDYKLDQDYMRNILFRIDSRLRLQYSSAQSNAMMDKLNGLIARIDFSKLSEGLGIYISPSTEQILHFPFPITSEKVIVDETFEVRDLIQAMKMCRSCLLVIISHNKVRTFESFDCSLSEVKFLDMPDSVKDVHNEHSLPGWDYFDSRSWEEKNVHNYLHFIDVTIEKELNKHKHDVIVLGDRKLLGFLKKHTRIGDKVIGYIEGNYENATPAQLKKLIMPLVEKENKREEEYAMRLLAEAIDKDNFAAGISQVWRAATEGRGRLLLVEKDYRQPARIGQDSFSLNLDMNGNADYWKVLEDAVDDIMQKVLKNRGDIVFVDNEKLKEYQRIVLINRY